APPSLSTLQHAQVLITELCALSLEISEGVSLKAIANHVQSLVSHISQSACNVSESFLLTQALYLNLMHFFTDPGSCDAALIAKQWAEQDLTAEDLFLIEFLGTLTTSLQSAVGRATTFILKMEILCLELLLSTLKHLNGKKRHVGCIEILLRIVQTNKWTPTEAVTLLKVLSEKYKEDAPITEVLTLVQVYDLSPEWTDDSGHSVAQALDVLGPERFLLDFCWWPTVLQMLRWCMLVLTEKTETQGLVGVKLDPCVTAMFAATKVLMEKWWPRATQLTSWCFLALSDTGKLLEMGTGEGKSCVIAMFAALRVLRGEKVDVVSSSSVLCQRDAEEWNHFYKYFDITADTNTNKTKDEDRKKCYQKDVVYGTIETFAADHLRQIFEMKDVRTDRSYQCIIIDEVDSLLLDQGVQLTYLSSPMVSMQHLNVILAMIWGHASQYGFLSTGHITFVQGPPCSFYKSIFDSIDMDGIDDPMDVLHIAEESGIVPKGFTEEMYNSEKDKLFRKLKTVSQDDVIDFFQKIEQFVPYGFTVYTLDDNGLLSLRKSTPYNNPDIPELTFLVLDDGLCSALYDSEEVLANPITEFILEKIQYTPCTNNTGKISIPGFLKNLIESKLPVWVQNAFLAKRLRQGREYVVENDCVCPVDYRSTGIVELNKKWGDGLQQFVEIKHQIKMSTISTVTNFISNLSFFEKYDGKIYGTTGTLGSETDMLFLQDLYPNLSACKMPTFNRRKLFEVKGNLETSAEEWKSKITHVVMDQICPNSFREGRAALVICETITKAKELYETLKSVIPGEIILYSRSDKDSLSKIDKKLDPGDVIVATNLAGRGTNIKVSKKVNKNGGLFVVLSFLSENTRVELQAFGRTARKGKPGSAQIIMTTDHVQESLKTVSSLEEAKETRNRLAAERINYMMADVTEMKLREDLFAEYCKTLHGIYRNTDGDERRVVVAIMNEFWGIWLQTKSEEIDNLKRNELEKSLKADLSVAQSQSQSQTSPCSSIYHYIKFGNLALGEKKWDVSMKLFEKAMGQDESWAAIAFYNHAYCSIKQQKGDYLTTASNDLKKAQESLKYLSEECLVCLQFVKMASVELKSSEQPTSLEKQLTTKCNLFSYFDKNICEAMEKLKEIKDKGRDATTKKLPMFSLVSSTDEDLQIEAYNLYSKGLEYVFSVEEQPRFPWEALLVFCLGILQIVGGALLTAFTFGTLAQDKNRKSKLLGIFKQISKTALQPFYADLEWQNKLNSSITKVIDSAASEAKGKTLAVLKVIQGIHMASLAAEATCAVSRLSSQFFSNLHKELNTFKEKNN
ncbi:unnamed protein product, partial [Pleuronectes platessa]